MSSAGSIRCMLVALGPAGSGTRRISAPHTSRSMPSVATVREWVSATFLSRPTPSVDEADRPCERCEAYAKQLENARVALVLADKHNDTVVRAREGFVQKLADQIRVPLHAVERICSAVAKRPDSSADTRIQMTTVCQTAGEILTTINDLLQVATIESGRWCMENVAFQPKKLLDLIIRLLGRSIFEKRLTFDQEVDASLQGSVAGDVSRLRQLLLTLHEILIDEAERGERVAVTVRVLKEDDPILAQMPRSKRFIACSFDMWLMRKGRVDMEPVDTGREADPRLVLEESIFLKSFCKNLALRGHAVDIARDVAEIVAMAESGSLHRTYDCALIDMSDGSFELVRSLRTTERRTGIQRLPVLVSVAYGTDDWERRYLDAGIDGHFLKPCSEDVILGRIGDTISAVNALVSIHEDSVSQGSSTDGVNVGSRSSESAFKNLPETPLSGDRSVR
ncbi:hypothetical protein KFL_002190200 [Klebsormidium nitens]|uniref:Response regulatory domain-containing protein n=1 Tax=Klebsormidium nitens TaxID=105231 RepID=A0A1Y1I2B9_KLENI|nr:hypothetical protein KFL_002190200 [Klebsormidium nitens]|eukprot:GAQ85065.1 hypothetical protein KFL_002190200 [Klebsormidium nitens]